MELNHGGDWAGFQEKYGKLPLDFSASTTPLPMPEGMRTAVLRSLDRADRYPDPLCRELTAALGKKHHVPPDHILCGAGAADLLFRLVQAKLPRRAMIVEPAFSGYEEALRTVNCQIERFFLREKDGFVLTEDLLPCIKPGLDMLFLCSPNNPTGRSVPTGLLGKIRERCRRCGTLLVLDACFGGFLPGPAQDGPFVLRSFTKWYPMAGLRLGYAVCPDRELLEEMRRQGPPWAVPAPAQAARERGFTRAVAAMEKAARQFPSAVFAIGNAPTALLRAAELIQSGLLRPALVIGVPVGFVNVVESKETALAVCQANGIPAILAMGRKGGSGVAASICNALLYQAVEITSLLAIHADSTRCR